MVKMSKNETGHCDILEKKLKLGIFNIYNINEEMIQTLILHN